MILTLEIDERLLEEAKSLDRSKTNEEMINLALVYYVRFLGRQDLLSLKGKVTPEGNSKGMRGGEGE